MQQKARRFTRRTPDLISEELVAVLSDEVWTEFKPLFLLVQSNLRARNAASGDPEMLRLRAYEKLQNLVQHRAVEKRGKEYRGIAAALKAFADQHCRPLHPPKPSSDGISASAA